MRAIDVKRGNEIFFGGELQIATEDAKQATTEVVYLYLLPVSMAGVQEDGTLEFGQNLGRRQTLSSDPGDIPLTRTEVPYRTGIDYVDEFPNPNLITKGDRRREIEQSMRSELVRVALRRKAAEAAIATGEAQFRKTIRRSIDAGISVAEIQERTGLSRARVYQIRDNRR